MQGPLAPNRFAELYTFGWHKLADALREHAWFYVLLALVAAGLSAITRPTVPFSAADINLLAFIPALAFATRLARPDFQMKAKEVLGLLVIWFIVNGVFSALVALARIWNALLIVLLFIIIPYVWIAVKLTLAQPIYLLRSPSESILDALSDSSNYVEGDTWWRIVGLQILIVLPAAIIVLFMSYWQTTFAGAFIVSAASIVTTVWSQISLVALASNTGVPEEHTGAVTV